MTEDYQLQTSISYWDLETPYGKDLVEATIAKLKTNGAQTVFDQIYKMNCPVVVETHIEAWDDPYGQRRVYKLHYRLTAVQNRNIVMPVFTFTNHLGETEWKCPACAMINKIEASFCGEKHKNAAGCGRPRDKTVQQHVAESGLYAY